MATTPTATVHLVEFPRKAIAYADQSTTLRTVDPDGEITFEFSLAPGPHELEQFIELLSPGEAFELVGGKVVYPVGQAVKAMTMRQPGFVASGANPDWRPSSADRARREMEQMLREVRTHRAAITAEQRKRDADKLDQAAKKAKEPEPTPEPEPEPAVEPQEPAAE